MAIDLIGTWLIGVPPRYISEFVPRPEIPYVYFILSLEECVRLSSPRSSSVKGSG